ncbi:predicted protein [Phaeodactylum tricornutum CCAP 1055/1]|jgi:hypothetical protein|uniref:Uncharacterized protein n=1 Tax=Phaeodactylum tricornutum (strain CCAP 1055/1) TaxID=556484 RepID=B7G3N7_PHATC|nr:predicted protein [Phaeodactylum tricornutum CCAP 1055/1]XP_002185610.1 predicted protein [Phaeodactylum tricornutum CCAP 1055/1]EEC42908.1 predicted protein [Phaeodactylum tricornutum CCAP 1055/1]EEC46861.1 predicted protein [Phaeodactylum tricornutum CCAP 1055/1]|eukprot:XP_002181647.1 predicted protein [Phaeodactylum tricornutum CCAP 1055/1]
MCSSVYMVSDVCIKGRGTVAVDNAYSRADWKTTKSFSETLKHRKSKQFKRCFYTFPTQCMLEWRLGVAVRAYSGTPKAPSGGPLSGMETLKHRKSKQFKRCFYTFPTQCMLEWRLGVAVRAYSGTPKAPSGGPLSGMGRFRNVMEVARPAQPVMVVEHTV